MLLASLNLISSTLSSSRISVTNSLNYSSERSKQTLSGLSMGHASNYGNWPGKRCIVLLWPPVDRMDTAHCDRIHARQLALVHALAVWLVWNKMSAALVQHGCIFANPALPSTSRILVFFSRHSSLCRRTNIPAAGSLSWLGQGCRSLNYCQHSFSLGSQWSPLLLCWTA